MPVYHQDNGDLGWVRVFGAWGRWRGRWRGRRRSRTKTPVISITGTKKASENKPRKQRTAHFEPSCGGTCVIQTRPRDKRRPAIYETTASQGEEDRTEQDGGLKGDLRTGPCRKTHTNRAADRPPDTNKHQTPKNLCPVIPKTLIPRTHRRPETGQTKTIDRSPDETRSTDRPTERLTHPPRGKLPPQSAVGAARRAQRAAEAGGLHRPRRRPRRQSAISAAARACPLLEGRPKPPYGAAVTASAAATSSGMDREPLREVTILRNAVNLTTL